MSPSSASPQGTHAPLAGARLARVPIEGLAALAALRGREDVAVRIEGAEAWVSWRPADGTRDEVVEALLPVPGATFYRRDAGRWYRVGRRLPEFGAGPPLEADATGMPLHRAVLPEQTRWEGPRADDWRPATLRVVPDTRPRPASALLVLAEPLRRWAESAPTARLEALKAARSGDRVLLIGRRLPPVAGLGRYWGARVLLPIGRRAEPALPESRLVEALGLEDEAMGLIGPDGRVEVVPGRALAPLSRSAARRMAGLSDRLPAGGGGGSGSGSGSGGRGR